MTAVLALLAGMLVVGGIVMGIAAMRPGPEKPAVQRRVRRTSPARRFSNLSKRTRYSIVIGLIAGIVAAAASGFLGLIIAVPAAIIGLPILLGKQDTYDRDVLSALESWSRSLAAASSTGRLTLREVISVTRTSTPEILRASVDQMAIRMNTTWSNSQALRAFAEEMHSAWVDEVAIYLIQAADYSSNGLADALKAIADNLAAQVKLRQEIYKEREKPRRVMIQIAYITLGTIAVLILMSRTQSMQAYGTPVGQVLMLVTLGVMALLMIWARSIGRSRPEPRFLFDKAPGGAK